MQMAKQQIISIIYLAVTSNNSAGINSLLFWWRAIMKTVKINASLTAPSSVSLCFLGIFFINNLYLPISSMSGFNSPTMEVRGRG